jgi:hypothetical protein
MKADRKRHPAQVNATDREWQEIKEFCTEYGYVKADLFRIGALKMIARQKDMEEKYAE